MDIRIVAFVVTAALAVASGRASAAFVVNEPWVLPADRARTSEVYANLSSSEGVTVLGVSTDVARSARIQAPQTKGGLTRLPLPAGSIVRPQPGATRIVLVGLKRSLRPGDRVPITLVLQGANGVSQDILVDAEVRWRSPTDDHGRAHRHGR